MLASQTGKPRTLVVAGCLALLVGATAGPGAAAQAAAAAQSFENPAAAVAALVDALRTGRLEAVRTVLGPGSERLLSSGDKVADAAGFVAEKSKDAVTEAGDKAEDAKDKTVDVSKKVGEKTVDASKTVGEKSVEGAKKVGSATATGAKKAGKAVKKVIP